MSVLDEIRRLYGTGAAPVRQTNRATPPRPPGNESTLDEIRRLYGDETVYASPSRDEELLRPRSQAGRMWGDIPEPVREQAGGAVRHLASALEPVQLPQDAMFATIAGATDPNSTITERLSTMQWGRYAPGGEAPARPSSGEEIFSLMGMEPQAAKWAGIAADLTVDPLVFGSWLRVTGKVAGMSDMVRLGDQMDNYISPIGMGREVNRLARRSEPLSRFMDTRMNNLMQVFRDPDSTVFGVRRFGERATGALEYALPKEQVDRLRFGSEAASELASARRAAESTGLRIPEESIRMLHRAQHGIAGENSKDIVRNYIRGVEDQVRAYESRLGSLDPTVREVIESEVYRNLQPNDEGPGIGLMAFLGTRENMTRVFGDEAMSPLTEIDESVQRLAGEVYESAAADLRSVGPSRRAIDPDEVFLAAQRRAENQLDPARRHVGDVARERAQAAGLGGQELHNAEGAAVRAFNGYLADSLQIDARLGMATSGYDFVSRTVRKRANDLAGNLDQADNIWNRILHVGMRGGDKAIKSLKEESTGIPLRRLLARDRREIQDTVRRRQVREAAIAAELERIRGGAAAERTERIGKYVSQSDQLANRAENLVEGTHTALNAFPGWHEGSGSRLITAVREATATYRQRAADVAEATGSGAPELARFLQAERALSTALRRYGDLMTNLSVPLRRNGRRLSPRQADEAMRATERMPRFAVDFIDRTRTEAQTISEDLAAMSSRRREYRTEYQRRLKEQQRAAREANANLGRIGDEAADQVPPLGYEEADEVVGYLNLGGDQIPLAAKDTDAEDILAARLRAAGKDADLEAEAAKPITFGELMDGTADMQALPIGAFLEGLMNGHMRRTYALFGDSSDFKKYMDALRSGVIVPSKVIDEANLESNMPGYEDEAKLILKYHSYLVRGERGQVLKSSSIQEYLLNSGVAPERVRGAMKSMAQSINPDSGPLRGFLNRMEGMLPQYQQILRARDESLNRIGDVPQPRVVDTRFYDEVKNLDKEDLQMLGEIAQARASLGDQIDVTRRVLGRQEAFQNIYEVAQRRGLIKGSRHTDEFGVRYVKYADSQGVMGGFSGKYIHPHLYEELRRMSSVDKTNVPYAFTRLRSLITGGFLAAPSVIAANFFGGLYQGAMAGINPAVMIRRLIETAPDVNRASLGYKDNLATELGRHIDLQLGSMQYQNFEKYLKRIRLDDFGLGPQGINRVFDQVADGYEQFLQRPGIGRFRTRFAGLEGFQFTENWFKVASYREMKDKLTRAAREAGEELTDPVLGRIEREAAEFARTVVFDYSELPRGLDILKRYGVVLFPGFPYFLAGRTMEAAMKRPGTLAVSDRLSEAMANASLDLEDQLVLLHGTPEYMRDDQGVPMPFTMRRGREGEGIVDVVPLNQLIPTSTIWDTLVDGRMGSGNPWGESIAGMGLIGPFYEMVRAILTGEGEAVLSAKYGNRVFDADSVTFGSRLRDLFRFSYNTLAPSNVKKLITVDMENQLSGLLPALPEMFQSMTTWGTEDMMEGAYSFEEHRRRRPDQDWRADVLRLTLRSPQTIALSGQVAGVRRELQNEQARLKEQTGMLRRRLNRATAEGDEEAAQRHSDEIIKRETEFNEKWAEFLDFFYQYEVEQYQRDAR